MRMNKICCKVFITGCNVIGSEPAGLTVHPPPPTNDRGWVHFFLIGVWCHQKNFLKEKMDFVGDIKR